MVRDPGGTIQSTRADRTETQAASAFPSQEELSGWCTRVGLPQDMAEALACCRERAAVSEALYKLFHTVCARLALHADWPDPTEDEEIKRACGDSAWAFGLIAWLSMLPRAEAWYRAHGIGMDIFDATMADIGLWGVNNTERHGAVRFSEFGWIHVHLSCRLFRLGRLQFVLQPYDGDALFLRHRGDGRIVAVAMPGVRIRSDGYLDGTDGWTDENAWTTELQRPDALTMQNKPVSPDVLMMQNKPASPDALTMQNIPASPDVLLKPSEQMRPNRVLLPGDGVERSGSWIGHPIDPNGRTHREQVEFPCSDWEAALQPGDDTLDVHIPQGSPLDIPASLASFEQALPFFRRVFPQREPHAYHCHSWLLAPQFDSMLPDTSNIVRFAQLFHRYPSGGDRQQAWERVFGHHAPTLAEAPRTSSLQRILHDWLSEGKLVCSMAGMHFPE